MSNFNIQSIYSLTSPEQQQQQESLIKLSSSQQKVKQIIIKGMEIVPWFKKHELRRVFKECYENESLFINKLKNIKIVDEGEEGWIVQGDKKGKKKEKEYSFLKDEKLMRRVEGNGESHNQGQYNKRNEKRYNKDNHRRVDHHDTHYQQKSESRKYIEKRQNDHTHKNSSKEQSQLSISSNNQIKNKQPQQQIPPTQQIDPTINQTFSNLCKQNPYILPFITPNSKTQRIQYIIDNTNISNVKVRIITQV